MSGESSGRGDSPGEETSTSLLAMPGVLGRGVKKSVENLLRLNVGVEENRKEPPFPLLTGATFPNCLADVFKGFGGLSVALNVPIYSETEIFRCTFLGGSFKGM